MVATERQALDVIVASIHAAAVLFCGREGELGRLDAAVGDGDHGAAMLRGWNAAAAAVDALPQATPGALLAAAGAAFADEAGGASGALFGAWLAALGRSLGAGELDALQVSQALQAGLQTVCKLGKAAPGDKTFIDALAPFAEAFAAGAEAGQGIAQAWHAALPAATAGAAATVNLVARRGRSSRLGERSLGHVDAGAQSMAYLLGVVDEVLHAQCG